MQTPFIRGRNAQITVGLDPEMLKKVDEVARIQHSSRPAIVRQAIALFLSQNIEIVDSEMVDTNGADHVE